MQPAGVFSTRNACIAVHVSLVCHVQTIPAHSDPVTAVDIHRDGTLAISASYDGLIRMWNMDDGGDNFDSPRLQLFVPVSPLYADREVGRLHLPL